MQTNIYFWSYFAHFFLEWEMLQIKVVEKIKTHNLCLIIFSRKSCRLWDNVEKRVTAKQATKPPHCYAYTYTLPVSLIFHTRNGLWSLCLHTATFKHIHRLTVFLCCSSCLWVWSLTMLTSDRLTESESALGIYNSDGSAHFRVNEGAEIGHHNEISAEYGIRAKRQV